MLDPVTGDLSDTRTRYLGSRPVKLFRVRMQGQEAVSVHNYWFWFHNLKGWMIMTQIRKTKRMQMLETWAKKTTGWRISASRAAFRLRKILNMKRYIDATWPEFLQPFVTWHTNHAVFLLLKFFMTVIHNLKFNFKITLNYQKFNVGCYPLEYHD